jgi:predicted nucleic acid-binding protein
MTNRLRCVVDTSVCIKHFIPDPLSPKVDQLLVHVVNPQHQFFVPDLFYIECANTLWKYVRAGLYPTAKVSADFVTLKAFNFCVISTADLMEDAVNIGLAYGISAYDASYVALSKQVSATLLTLDAKLVRALAATSYDVCSFNDFQVPPLR